MMVVEEREAQEKSTVINLRNRNENKPSSKRCVHTRTPPIGRFAFLNLAREIHEY